MELTNTSLDFLQVRGASIKIPVQHRLEPATVSSCAHRPQSLCHSLGIAVLATLANLYAASHGIPCEFRPFDVAVCCHRLGASVLEHLLGLAVLRSGLPEFRRYLVLHNQYQPIQGLVLRASDQLEPYFAFEPSVGSGRASQSVIASYLDRPIYCSGHRSRGLRTCPAGRGS